jgi:hypothetical protein
MGRLKDVGLAEPYGRASKFYGIDLKSTRKRPILVAVLVPVATGIPGIPMHQSAKRSSRVSVDIATLMHKYASPCEAMQNPENETHNPLVRGSNPCRPTIESITYTKCPSSSFPGDSLGR